MDGEDKPSRIEQYKIPGLLLLVGMVLLAGGLLYAGFNQAEVKDFPQESMFEQKLLTVDISGAVARPGVYQLKEGARIQDLLDAAGGLTDSAHPVFISKYLNKAQKISDGTKLYIPENSEQLTVLPEAVPDGQANVNINTASRAEIENLPGIGPVLAEKIISNRPYQGIADLLERKIISQALFEKIKQSLAVY